MSHTIATPPARRPRRRLLGLAVVAGALLAPGAAQAADFAVVEADGDLARGSNATRSSKLVDGQYQVNFNKPVNDCILTASAGDPGSVIQDVPVTITVGPISGNPNAAFVVIREAVTGVGRDQAFHLNVTCAGTGVRAGVVDAAGNLARGLGAAAGATRISTGQYEVRFTKDVGACAYNASIGGSLNTNVSRGMVAVAKRFGNTKALHITTFDAATGALADRSFHVNVTCGAKKRFVVTNDGGNLVRHGRPAFPRAIVDGNYEVTFDRDISKCAHIATTGNGFDDPETIPRHMGTSLRSFDPKSLFVAARDRNGFRVPQGFHLVVVC